MRLYKTSEHAIRAVIYLAMHKDRVVSVMELKEKLNMPYKYVGRLMPVLGRSGILEVKRGKSGGYKIARPLDQIYIKDVVDAVEGLDNYKRCILGFPECSDDHPCPIHPFWAPIRNKILNNLLELSLEEIMKNQIYKI
jgi:Rrf2 family protein